MVLFKKKKEKIAHQGISNEDVYDSTPLTPTIKFFFLKKFGIFYEENLRFSSHICFNN